MTSIMSMMESAISNQDGTKFLLDYQSLSSTTRNLESLSSYSSSSPFSALASLSATPTTTSTIAPSSSTEPSPNSVSTYQQQLVSLCQQLFQYDNQQSSNNFFNSTTNYSFHWNNVTKKICNKFFTMTSSTMSSATTVLPSAANEIGYNFYENSVDSIYSRLPTIFSTTSSATTTIDISSTNLPLSSYVSNEDFIWNNEIIADGGVVNAGIINGTLLNDSIDDSMAGSGISPNLRIMLIIFLSLMIMFTVIGNILVCLSVILVRKLRHPSNYLLVSLAISDLCVAILVMPLALQYELTSSWNLTNAICDLWVSFDVTCCTSSILNLCTISIDRYLAITKPLTYGVRRTTRRILSFIGAVWIGSCLISIPPVLILGNEHGTDQQPICEVSQNIGYQLYATLGAFYIPLLVMIVLYYKIYIAAKRVVDAELRDQRPSSCSKGGVSSSSKALLKRTRDSNNKQTVSLTKNSKKTTTNPHQYHQRGHHHHNPTTNATSYANSLPIVPNTIVSKCDPHTIITATTAPSDVEHNCCCSNKCWYKLSPTTPTVTPTFTPTTTTNSSRNGSSSSSSSSGSSSGSSGSDGRGDSGIFIRPNDDGGSTSTEKSCLTCCCGGGSTSESVKFTNNSKNKKSAITTSTQLVPTSGTPTTVTKLKKCSKSKKTKDNKSNKRMTLLFTRRKPPSSSTILMRMNTIRQEDEDDIVGSGQQSTNQPIATTTIPTVCCNNDNGATIGDEPQCCCVIVNSIKGQTEEGEGLNKTATPTNNCCDYYHYVNNNSTSGHHVNHNKPQTANSETINQQALTNCHSPSAHHNVFKNSLNFVFKGVRIRGRSQTSNNSNNCDNNNNLKSMNILHTNNNRKIRGGGKILSNENSTNGNGNNRRSSINSLSHKRRTSNALRERKASFTLGIIMTAFTVCWLPFFILALIKPFATSLIEFPRFVHSVALWLGYVNSMLNPIIYVTFHQDFRRAFKYLLCLQCSTMGSRLRAEAYRSQYGKSGGSDTAIGPHNTVTFASNTAGGVGSKTSPTIGFLSGSNKKISNGGSNDSSPNRVHHHHHHHHHHHKQNPDQQRHTHHHHHHHHHQQSNNPDSPATPLLLPTAPSIVVNTNLNNHRNNSTNDMIITTNAPILFLPVETTPPQSPPITTAEPPITNNKTAIDCGIDSGIYTNNRHTYDRTLIQSTPTIIPPPPPQATIEFVATTT